MSTIDQAIVQDQLIGTEVEREEGYNRLFGEDKPEVPSQATVKQQSNNPRKQL